MKTEPAFPALPISRELNGELVYQSKGITIRDYFAAKAMSEMTWVDKKGSARECYEMADAMMDARK